MLWRWSRAHSRAEWEHSTAQHLAAPENASQVRRREARAFLLVLVHGHGRMKLVAHLAAVDAPCVPVGKLQEQTVGAHLAHGTEHAHARDEVLALQPSRAHKLRRGARAATSSALGNASSLIIVGWSRLAEEDILVRLLHDRLVLQGSEIRAAAARKGRRLISLPAASSSGGQGGGCGCSVGFAEGAAELAAEGAVVGRRSLGGLVGTRSFRCGSGRARARALRHARARASLLARRRRGRGFVGDVETK